MGEYKKRWMKAYSERNREAVRASARASYWAHRDARRAASREWNFEHPDYQNEWYHKNREKRRQQARAWYVRNRENRLFANREFHAQNRASINARYRERYRNAKSGLRVYNLARHLARQALGPIDKEWLVVLLGDPCVYCGGLGGSIDHVIPIARGGTNELSNLTSACRRCNSRKKDRPLLVFLLAEARR